MDRAIAAAIETYHELNPSLVDELEEEPSALEFMRSVAQNRPFVIRNAATAWTAVEKWNAGYLREVMGNNPVSVAVTPFGNADAIVERNDGIMVLAEPHEQLELFSEFLDYIQDERKLSSTDKGDRSVKYAQTQNDNLRGEYESLFADVPKDIPFARIALAKEADAINVWIGNERSVTALHKDNYENIYVQVRGRKHFSLLSPIEIACVNEQSVRRGRYVPGEMTNEEMVIQLGDDVLPAAVWDPDHPDHHTSPYSHLSRPLQVTLDEGDILYLPACWYHKVKQSPGSEGYACAVNYWYDMEFAGGFWTANNFMRDAVEASRH